jgi:hypothetical protein
MRQLTARSVWLVVSSLCFLYAQHIAHRPAYVTLLAPTCQINQLSAAELEREYTSHKKKGSRRRLACV